MICNCSIVVVAYNRVNSLKRLLNSLNQSIYKRDVTLHISIDAGDNKKVLEIANTFAWRHGKKVVTYHEQNLGLRKHIISCGDLTERYGNIIMLEDDLFVSPHFYEYISQAMEFYKDDNSIAGIATYSPRYNEHAKEAFNPLRQDKDTFFMQLPCSWGQAWTHHQWSSFKSWYVENNEIHSDSRLPKSIIEWPETSWKKYFAQYMLDKDKYFVYPYESFSTNYGEKGIHFKDKTNIFQVPLQSHELQKLNFAKKEDNSIIYDIYHENNALSKYLDENISNNITIDVYGSKNPKFYKKYLLSSKPLHYKILKSFDNSLIPHELNIKYGICGNEIFLYDTSQLAINSFSKTDHSEEDYLSRYISYYKLFNDWIKLKNNDIDINKYFDLNNIKSVAIYGAGEVGKRLYEEIDGSSVRIEYFIDNYVSENQSHINEIPIVNLLEFARIKSVDVIIVTVMYQFDNIYEYIKKIDNSFSVLSLGDIITELKTINNL